MIERPVGRKKKKKKLTEVGDPDGHTLVEHVEDHDDHEADDGGRDRRGHLGRHVLLQRLQLQVLVSQLGGEGEKGGQAVDGDGDDGRHDEKNLEEEKRVGRMMIVVFYSIFSLYSLYFLSLSSFLVLFCQSNQINVSHCNIKGQT